MLGVGKAAPAQFSAADSGSEFTAHSRSRPEDRLGGPFEILSQIGNIDFNRPFQKERHDLRRVFLFGFRSRWSLHPSVFQCSGSAKPPLRNSRPQAGNLRRTRGVAQKGRWVVRLEFFGSRKYRFDRPIVKRKDFREEVLPFWVPAARASHRKAAQSLSLSGGSRRGGGLPVHCQKSVFSLRSMSRALKTGSSPSRFCRV